MTCEETIGAGVGSADCRRTFSHKAPRPLFPRYAPFTDSPLFTHQPMKTHTKTPESEEDAFPANLRLTPEHEAAINAAVAKQRRPNGVCNTDPIAAQLNRAADRLNAGGHRALRGETLYRSQSFAGPVQDRYDSRVVEPEDRDLWVIPESHSFAVLRDDGRMLMTTANSGDAVMIAAVLNHERRRMFDEARVIDAEGVATDSGLAVPLRR